jgi:hypothetical protein
MLKKVYIRDGNKRVIGSVTTGFSGSFDSLVRDEHERVLGWSSEKFGTTRDSHGALISTNNADPGLLIRRTTER